MFDRVGGQPFFSALVDRFYAGVATDPVLRPLYPDDLVATDAAPALQPPKAAPPARRGRFWADRPAAAEPAAPQTAADADTVTTLVALSLPGGSLLLLPARPDDDDIPAIQAAARPLLELLADRGLLSIDERSTS